MCRRWLLFNFLNPMNNETKHIGVCICTYKRPELLQRLLRELAGQDTGGLFTFSISIVDNDKLRSAETTVLNFAATSDVPVTYDVEPVQNICMARNRGIANATGDLIAFIDDDEFPEKQWLLNLYQAIHRDGVAGVLGPVTEPL